MTDVATGAGGEDPTIGRSADGAPADAAPPAGRDGAGDAAAPDGGDTRTLARNGSLNLVGVTFYGLANFATVVLVTRRLGAGRGGAFLESIALFSILTTSALLGSDQGLLRFIARFRALDRRHDIRRTIVVGTVPVVVLATVAGLVVSVLAEPLSRLLSDGGRQDLTTYLRVMAPFLPLAALYQALVGGSRGFATMMPGLVIDRIGRPLLTLVAMFVVMGAGMGSAAIALAFVGPFAVALVPMTWWTIRRVRHVDRRAPGPAAGAPAPTLDRVLATEFWRFSAPRALGGVFQIAIIWLDSLMIGALASTREAGIYAAATRWLIAGTFAGMAISLAFGPQISFVLARREYRRANSLYQTATIWHMALAFPAYLTTMIFAPALLRTFGAGFGSGVTVMVVLGAANLFTASCGPINVLLLMAGKSSLSLVNNGVALAANVALNLVLIPRYGINGAAISWTVALGMTNVLPLWQVWRHPGLHPFSRGWLAVLSIAAVGVVGVQLVCRAVLGPTAAGLALALVATAAVYGALLHRYRDALDLDALLGGWRARRRPLASPTQKATTP